MKNEILKSTLYQNVHNAFVSEHKNVRVFDKDDWHYDFLQERNNIQDIRNNFKLQHELGDNFELVRFEII